MTDTSNRYFAIWSPTGTHIGLWDDERIAMTVAAENEGYSMEALVTASDYDALAYNAAESENNLAHALHQLAQVKYKLAEVEAERDDCMTEIEIAIDQRDDAAAVAHRAEAMLPRAYRLALGDAADRLEPKNPVHDWADAARQHHADAIEIRTIPTPTAAELMARLKGKADE